MDKSTEIHSFEVMPLFFDRMDHAKPVNLEEYSFPNGMKLKANH